jgi:hypothetical protein
MNDDTLLLAARLGRRLRSLACCYLALLALGCSEDETDEAAGSSDGPLYVLANEVYAADDSTSYLNLLHTLDIAELDYDQAVEYGGGRATIATYNGWLFVSSPEGPVVTRHTVDASGRLVSTGEISFGNYGFNELTIDEWSINFISETKAYLFNYTDGNVVVWNPSTLEISGEIAGPDMVREGSLLNGGTGFVRGNRLFRTYFWSNWETYDTSREQYLAVYDTENDALLELIPEQRCPGLGNRVSQDPAGNLYFSNWIWNVTETLTKDAPVSCALRIRPDEETFDADWVLRFPDLAEGRQGAMLNVLSDGRAVMSVFHDERVSIDAQTDPSELAGTDNWRIWSVDLERQTAELSSELPWMAGAASNFELDGRSFLFIPGEDWAITHVHELVDGHAKPAFDVRGWSFQLQKLR